MQVTLWIVALWIAVGVACVICQGPTLLLGMINYNYIQRHGRVPSAWTEVKYLAGIIVMWPRWFRRLCGMRRMCR